MGKAEWFSTVRRWQGVSKKEKKNADMLIKKALKGDFNDAVEAYKKAGRKGYWYYKNQRSAGYYNAFWKRVRSTIDAIIKRKKEYYKRKG